MSLTIIWTIRTSATDVVIEWQIDQFFLLISRQRCWSFSPNISWSLPNIGYKSCKLSLLLLKTCRKAMNLETSTNTVPWYFLVSAIVIRSWFWLHVFKINLSWISSIGWKTSFLSSISSKVTIETRVMTIVPICGSFISKKNILSVWQPNIFLWFSSNINILYAWATVGNDNISKIWPLTKI